MKVSIASEVIMMAEDSRQKQRWATPTQIENMSADLTNLMEVAKALLYEVKTLHDALRPFAKFAEQWNRAPIRGLDDELYRIHAGTEYEAALRLSDCERARELIE